MKWLVILLFLPLFSFGQQVEDFWYFGNVGKDYPFNVNFLINEKDSVEIYIRGWDRVNDFHRGDSSIISDSSLINPEIHLKASNEYKVNSINYQNIGEDVDLSVLSRGVTYDYYHFKNTKTVTALELFDTIIKWEKPLDSKEEWNTIIQYNKRTDIIKQFTYPISFSDFILDVNISESSILLFCHSKAQELSNLWIPRNHLRIINYDTIYNMKTIELSLDFDSFRVFDYKKDTIIEFGSFGGSINPGIQRIPDARQIMFSFGKHIIGTGKISRSNSRHFEIRDFKNLRSIKIDTINTNFSFTSTRSFHDKLFFTSESYRKDYLRVNNDSFKISNLTHKGTQFGYIDSKLKVHLLQEFDTCYQSFLFENTGQLWLRIVTDGSVTFNGREFPSQYGAIHYFRIDESGEFIAHSIIPKFSGDLDIERYELMHAYPFIHKNHVYDINYFFNVFYDGEKPYATRGRGSHVYFPVLTKTKIRELAVAKPLATYSSSCSNIWLNLKYSDADHYTLLVSPDSVITPLKDGQGYNYALDYLLAPNYHGSKLMYQGNDTLVHLKNLVSGKKYYLHIIPGKGQNENSTYNTNAVLTLEINLPSSALQNSLSINPKTDTASCQSDTNFATATSSYPIRWMDGKTENRRFVPETGDYYFTIKDSQECVVSSDTVTFTKHPTPQINRIVASQKPPFCLGDSVWFAANSFVLGSHPDSIKYASKAMKTGWYIVKLTNRFDCQSTDSIYVEFGQKPTFKFLQDSVLSMNNRIRLDFKSNADSLIWVYDSDTIDDYDYLMVNDSQYLFVNAIDQSGCNIWDSILTMYKKPISEAFPNAFSPNGDGLNDEWYFLHPDTAGTLIIYDRWGGIVHHGPNRWDGKKNGQTLPIGAFRYTFIYQENGVEKVKRGLITLIR